MSDLAGELRKWWRFDEYQRPLSSWHEREDFIVKVLPELEAETEREWAAVCEEREYPLRAANARLRAAHTEIKEIALQAEIYHRQLGASAVFKKIAEIVRRALEQARKE